MFKKVSPDTIQPAVREKAMSIMQQLPPHYPVLTATELLRGKQFPQILSQIQTLAFAPDIIFENFYQQAIHSYAEFVQGLPATHIDHFNYHGGLLELGIRRALQTLAWYRREYPVRQHTPENLPAREAIWSYALFTAGLVFGVGQVVATYWVMLCHVNGQPHKLWNPVAGNMTAQYGEYYRYSFETTRRDELAARSTLVLALEILPAAGVSWIASDKEIFNAWLAILLRDESHAGLFAKCIFPLEAEFIEKPNEEAGNIIGDFIEQLDIVDEHADKDKKKTEKEDAHQEDKPRQQQQGFDIEDRSTPNVPGRTGVFAPGKEITALDLGMGIGAPMTGVLFLLWLRNGIRSHQFSALRDMMVVPEGTLISQDLIQRFAKEHTQLGNAQSVYEQLKKSPFCLGEAFPQAATTLAALAQNQKHAGLLLDTAALLGKKIPGGGINYDQRLTIPGIANYPPQPIALTAGLGQKK